LVKEGNGGKIERYRRKKWIRDVNVMMKTLEEIGALAP